jgi:hypothetical protein
MKTYRIELARTETVVYYFEEIKAENQEQAEEIAWSLYEQQEYDELDTVYGEENIHYIEEVTV